MRPFRDERRRSLQIRSYKNLICRSSSFFPSFFRFQWTFECSSQFLAEYRDAWKRLTHLIFFSFFFTNDLLRERSERANSCANWRELARIFTQRYGLKIVPFKRALIEWCPLYSFSVYYSLIELRSLTLLYVLYLIISIYFYYIYLFPLYCIFKFK